MSFLLQCRINGSTIFLIEKASFVFNFSGTCRQSNKRKYSKKEETKLLTLIDYVTIQ